MEIREVTTQHSRFVLLEDDSGCWFIRQTRGSTIVDGLNAPKWRKLQAQPTGVAVGEQMRFVLTAEDAMPIQTTEVVEIK